MCIPPNPERFPATDTQPEANFPFKTGATDTRNTGATDTQTADPLPKRSSLRYRSNRPTQPEAITGAFHDRNRSEFH